MPAIKMKDVSYHYPQTDTTALRKVNLEVGYGEFVGIVGLNGSGKTTLFRLINGLIPHYFGGDLEGEVSVDGLDVKQYSVGALATRVGMVFQELDEQIFYEIDDEVEPENIGMSPHEIEQTVNEILVGTGLTQRWYNSPKNLSKGQKQLMAISHVLAMKPRIQLLDEPTSHLDPVSSKRILDLIKNLNQEGFTIILATNEIDLLAEYATRIVIMYDGQIEASGSTLEIFSNPQLFRNLGLKTPQISQLAQKLCDGGFSLLESPPTVRDMYTQAMKRLNV